MMYDFKFSDIGEGLHEGKILKWNFKVGDKVKEGDTLVVVETDKVNAELPSPVNGIIVKLGAAEGEIIHVGETVVLIDDGKGGRVGAETKAASPAAEPVSEESAPGVIGEIQVSSEIIGASSESVVKNEVKQARVLATPAARKVARDLGVDIQTVRGSGPSGRVMKADIEKVAIGATTVTTSVPVMPVNVSRQGDVTIVPITKLRKSIVKAMTISKQVIPHTVLMDEVVIDDLVSLRDRAKVSASQKGIKLTYMAFIIKATTLALREFPMFNASFDHIKEEVIIKNYLNIGIAVDTPDGLIVPNIKDADAKSIFTLAKELTEIATLTRERKIQLASLQNTTFTITNFGAMDIAFGTPIINHPEVGILGVGKIGQKPVVRDGALVIAHVLPLSIAVDHRIIDGADAGRFLIRVKELLGNPDLMLLG
ncbi:MAG: dihydrolipoamide acetyltransferase family protein [Bacilli bacterium]